jgi:thermitase
VSSPSPKRRETRSGRDALRLVGALFAVWCSAGSALAEASAPPCDPIEAPRQYAQLAPSQEPGPLGRLVGDAEGAIVSLAVGEETPVDQQAAGEALLVMSKRPDGTIGSQFELSPGARIVDSFWSPVLCATVARVVGDPLAEPAALFGALPDDAVLTPNHIYVSAVESVRPVGDDPDPYRKLQHGLERLGVEAAGLVSTGRGVRIAVLDSAPEAGHRDLAGVRVALVEDGPDAAPSVHGTLTTGVIAAVPHNGFGIAGAAPDAEVIAIPVCRPHGATPRDTCGLFDVLRGLDLAWDERADVLNLSVVGPPNPLLERATRRLDDLGVLIVAAAGNEGTDQARYPAAYPSVVGVGSLDADGLPVASSNRGPSAEIWAPGAEILSTVPGGAFAFASGTSFAAAHVSGALAVLIGSGVSHDDARRALFQAAQQQASRAPAPAIAPLCGALEQLGHACPSS